MSGLLIYTASGDSEGTLGGLVRMGKPGFLEQIIEQALREAEWCSNDPVCSESGEVQEDGDVINRLSACYAFKYVRESNSSNSSGTLLELCGTYNEVSTSEKYRLEEPRNEPLMSFAQDSFASLLSPSQGLLPLQRNSAPFSSPVER